MLGTLNFNLVPNRPPNAEGMYEDDGEDDDDDVDDDDEDEDEDDEMDEMDVAGNSEGGRVGQKRKRIGQGEVDGDGDQGDQNGGDIKMVGEEDLDQEDGEGDDEDEDMEEVQTGAGGETNGTGGGGGAPAAPEGVAKRQVEEDDDYDA